MSINKTVDKKIMCEEDLWLDWGSQKLQCSDCGTWFNAMKGICDYCGNYIGQRVGQLPEEDDNGLSEI